MGSQVAVAEVAVVPTFKGFRAQVTKETDGSAKAGAQGFSRAFARTGTDSGKQVGTGFKKAFEQSAAGTSDRLVKQMEANVAKASRAVSDARLREQDAAGKVRIAEKQLAESREKYASDSSQVVRAQERLESASRSLARAHDRTGEATDDLKRAQGELARAADRAGDELAEAGTRGVTRFRSNVVGGVAGFAGPLVAAFAALGIGNIVADAFRDAYTFVKDSVGLASDLEQSIGGVDAVFGDQAKTIKSWSKAAADSVGLSQSKYNEFATVIGSQFKNMGVPIDQVAGKTNDLITLAADLAATYGGTTADAVSALSSLLRGETDPIEKYGVSINDAMLESRLLAKGLDGLEGPARDEAKRQERLALLYEQTKDAQGGAIREQDTYASKMQSTAAKWENLTARIGEAFLPTAASIADILSNDVFPVIEDLVDEYGPEMADAFADILPDLTKLAKDVLPEIPGLIRAMVDGAPAVISFFGDMAKILGPLIGSLAGFLGLLQANSDYMSGDLSFSEYLERVTSLGGGIGDLLKTLAGFVYGFPLMWDAAKVATKVKIDQMIDDVKAFPSRVLNALGDLRDDLVQSGKDLIGGFIRGLSSVPIGPTMSGIMREVQGYFPHSPAKEGPFAGSGWTQLERSGTAFWDQWVSGMGRGESFPWPEMRFSESGGGSVVLPQGATPSGGPATVNIYPTFRQEDARLQMRQWGREAGRAFAAA